MRKFSVISKNTEIVPWFCPNTPASSFPDSISMEILPGFYSAYLAGLPKKHGNNSRFQGFCFSGFYWDCRFITYSPYLDTRHLPAKTVYNLKLSPELMIHTPEPLYICLRLANLCSNYYTILTEVLVPFYHFWRGSPDMVMSWAERKDKAVEMMTILPCL